MNAIGTELLEMAREVLALPDAVADAPLVAQGASSLNLMRLIARLFERWDVLVELDRLLGNTTVADLAALVAAQPAGAAGDPLSAELPTADSAPETPLGPYELPFWDVRSFLPAKRAYNEVVAYILSVELDRDRCRDVVARLVAGYPALRSAFLERADGVPVRRVLDPVEIGAVELDWQDFSGEVDPMATCAARVRALATTDFQLDRPPLFKPFVWKIAPGRQVVGAVLYHIIGDLWSIHLLADAAQRALRGEPLAQRVAGEVLAPRWSAEDVDYWRAALADRPLPLGLPARARPAFKSFKGDVAARRLGLRVARIEPARRALGVTGAALGLSAFALLLSAAARADALIVGVPHLLRDDPALRERVGVWLNTLPVRVEPGRAATARDLVQHTQGRLAEAMAHGRYPIGAIEADAGAAATLSRAPLFDHLFTWFEAPASAGSDGGDPPPDCAFATGTSKLDLSLFVRRRGDVLDCRLEFATPLFRPDEAARLLDGYELLLDRICAAPETTVEALGVAITTFLESGEA